MTDPRTPRRRVEGAERADILKAGTEWFARDGYEYTRGADVTSDIVVGSTGLYHYFDSKQHRLFAILEQATADSASRFDRLRGEDPDAIDALVAILRDSFELTEQKDSGAVCLSPSRACSRMRGSHREGLGATDGASPDGNDPARLVGSSRSRDRARRDPARGPKVPWRVRSEGCTTASGLVQAEWQRGTARGVAEFYVPRILALIGVVA